MRIAVLCNPENRRFQYVADAVQRLGGTAVAYSYAKLLARRFDMAAMFADADALRIESPGENHAVEQLLLAQGAADMPASAPDLLPAKCALELPEDRGRIRHHRQWYLGFKRLMDDLATGASAAAVPVMNAPKAIVQMFDKQQCHQLFAANDVPTPKMLAMVSGYDEVHELAGVAEGHQLFLKPLHGSSASGVVAYRRYGKREMATTSVEIERGAHGVRLYNSLRIRRYQEPSDIRALIDTLAKEPLLAEQWLPKASVNGQAFDFRIVVIGGRARHMVARCSRSPMTNLHLGNRRGDIEALRRKLGEARWHRLRRVAEQAAAVFPNAHYVGLDVMLHANGRDVYVIEANAFGDLLPGVLDGREDCYTAELRAWPPCAAGLGALAC